MASRSESPSRLNASTVIVIASPGSITRRGSVTNRLMWSASIVPQVGVGGGTPTPRYDSVASNRIVAAMPSEA